MSAASTEPRATFRDAIPAGPASPAWPSGLRPDDPEPVPITLTNLWRWALVTARIDRRYRMRLARPTRPMLPRVAASILPTLDRPIFLIGAARSGTTFLGDCIGRLPEISYHFEPPATKAAGRYAYEGPWSERRTRAFYRLVYRWLLRLQLDGGLRFSEKTPTNAFLIPFLDRAFPGAQFVHIVRDGRDASVSLLKQPWLLASSRGSGVREPGGYLIGPYAQWWVERDRRDEFEGTGDVHRAIWSWRRYVEAALADGPPLGPDRYLEIRYEDLMHEPEATGDRLLRFLRIDPPASRTILVEALNAREPDTVGGWRREFTADDLAVIDAEAGPLLRRLGYT